TALSSRVPSGSEMWPLDHCLLVPGSIVGPPSKTRSGRRMTTVRVLDPGNAYSTPVTVTGVVPRLVIGNRNTSLALAGWLGGGGASVRYRAIPLATGSRAMVSFGAAARAGSDVPATVSAAAGTATTAPSTVRRVRLSVMMRWSGPPSPLGHRSVLARPPT